MQIHKEKINVKLKLNFLLNSNVGCIFGICCMKTR